MIFLTFQEFLSLRQFISLRHISEFKIGSQYYRIIVHYPSINFFFISQLAVNYEARSFGVTRNMRGDEAKEKCPDIILVKVPEERGKADLTKYRNAGKEVIQVLKNQFPGAVIERAS